MTRRFLCQRILRMIYGENPSEDATISEVLINSYINEAVASAAKKHYEENLQIEGVGFLNNSFFTTIRNLPITSTGELGVYQTVLPHIPVSLGNNEGVSEVYVVDKKGRVSNSLMQVTVYQLGVIKDLPDTKNIKFWTEGSTVYFLTSGLSLGGYTAKCRMVSHGSDLLGATINVPNEWLPDISQYILKALAVVKEMPKDVAVDGVDN